jgi:hypothetical protein
MILGPIKSDSSIAEITASAALNVIYLKTFMGEKVSCRPYRIL